MIKIIDCGSQFTQNIARRIREQGVYTEILPFNKKTEEIFTEGLEGIIISGGQFSVYDDNAPMYSPEVLKRGIPVLGICYGVQSIAHIMGGKVIPTNEREYGETKILLLRDSRLFSGIGEDEFRVWMSHGDIVESMPDGFTATSKSTIGNLTSMEKGNIYAVQFHPEVDHTHYGRKILKNFISICGAQKTWDPEKEYDRIVENLKWQIEGKIGVGGISGGVDSTTMSVLIGKIAGENYHPIFVDNGLLRLNEAEEVRKSLAKFNLNMHYVNASAIFLEKLKDVINPEEKRKIIGNEFINEFKAVMKSVPGAEYLAQGTLYPDVVESVPIYGSSAKIKSHHNVGGLPKDHGLKIIEPFKMLFKDELRAIAEKRLNMPKSIVWRHPFPGPGLGIRIVGSAVNEEKLRILREADHIYINMLKDKGIYYNISQGFAGLLNCSSVGVMGDAGTYQGIIALRAVTTDDFMSADWYEFKKAELTEISNKIINNVKGVNRVMYDTTQKPPATIEWE